MFSTLLGALPIDPAAPPAGNEAESRLDDLAALAATGLELVSDGGEPADPAEDAATVVARWQASARASEVPVKAVLLGPYSAARSSPADGSAVAVARILEDAADRTRVLVLALATAGCELVEIAEPDALPIATDPTAARSFRQAHLRLIDGSEGIHASLALTGGNLDGADPATFFDLAYASYAFDLIAGPDNWRLIAKAPADRGIICGALGFQEGADESREVLVWAAHYAASTQGRGLARVGLANAPASPPPSRSEALRKLAIVAEASRVAAVKSAEEMAGLLDPRAIDARSAAVGRFAPARRRRRG
jgi:hypothetical protein